MNDYILDLARWIDRYPLAEHREKLLIARWDEVFGVALLEQFRQQLRDEFGPFNEQPVDVLVWGFGEPEQRDMTKIGGLPYRPAGLPWPMDARGRPIGFVAQFRFTESSDLVGPTPGDVLLVFSNVDALGTGDCTDDFYFEWHPLGLRDLIQAAEMPLMNSFVTCYGVRHRTTEIVDPRVTGYVEELAKAAHADQEPWIWKLYRHAEYICQVESTKIAGDPLLNPENCAKLPGRHLCSLRQITKLWDVEYPWVNQPTPMTMQESMREDRTFDVMYDNGAFAFYLDVGGRVRCALTVLG